MFRGYLVRDKSLGGKLNLSAACSCKANFWCARLPGDSLAPPLGESFSDRRPSRGKKRVQGEEDKAAAKKKRRKARSGSSSSSSSSEEERPGKAAKSSKMKVDKSYEKMMDIMVSAVKNVEEKVKELSKNTKKSQQKVETDCQIVRDRVGEMTIAVQVIAENLDSVNDVGKKIEVLDTIQSGLSKLGSLDRLVERLEGQRSGAAPALTVAAPVPVPELAREGGWEGEQQERREPPPVDLSNMVQEVVARVDKKLCEFGSMIEGNLDRIERELKLDSGGPGKMKTLVDVTKALSSNSLKVLEVVKKTEKRFDTDPALMALGGPPIPPPPSNDYRLRELGDRVGEVLPKLDDIYIRVLPALEDIKQRARKESERENLTLKEIREQQVKVEKIMDMVEDMKAIDPFKLPIISHCDSWNLYQALHGTKMVEDKKLRVNIAQVKESVEKENVEVRRVTGDRMIANCLTKKGAKGAGLLDTLRTGELRGYII